MDQKPKRPIFDKVIVETTGSFILLNTDLQEINCHRPTVVRKTGFVEQEAGNGRLKILAVKLPHEASDEEFLEFWIDSNKDKELAISSYCAAYGCNPQGDAVEKVSKPAPRRTGGGGRRSNVNTNPETQTEGAETQTEGGEGTGTTTEGTQN